MMPFLEMRHFRGGNSNDHTVGTNFTGNNVTIPLKVRFSILLLIYLITVTVTLGKRFDALAFVFLFFFYASTFVSLPGVLTLIASWEKKTKRVDEKKGKKRLDLNKTKRTTVVGTWLLKKKQSRVVESQKDLHVVELREMKLFFFVVVVE